MDFKHINYHEKTMDILKKAINTETISHSYLFEGKEGIGKKMVAYVFSKTLLCQEAKDQPCNQCSSCISFDEGNHPDFFLIEPEKNMIRINQIEKLVGEMSTAPYESDRKVFIIDESDKMNLASQNKLLKTLEEPPGFVNIILLSSNPKRLLATILSRVQSIRLFSLTSDQVERIIMEDYGKTQAQAGFISRFTQAALERSISLAKDDDFFKRRDELINIVDSIIKGDKSKAFSSIQFFTENKDKIDEILDMIIYWFRDILIYKETGTDQLLINKDKVERLSYERNMEFDKINDIIENIMETKSNLRGNINFQLAIETMLLRI